MKKIGILLVVMFISGCGNLLHSGANKTSGSGTPVVQEQEAVVTTQGQQEENWQASDKKFHNQLVGGQRQIYYFEFDRSDIQKEDLESIQVQAQYLIEHPTARIVLEGHTDSRGSREYNVGLGERRANSAAKALELHGVPTRQIRVVSYGQERPAILGYTEEVYTLNRRVELVYEAV